MLAGIGFGLVPVCNIKQYTKTYSAATTDRINSAVDTIYTVERNSHCNSSETGHTTRNIRQKSECVQNFVEAVQ